VSLDPLAVALQGIGFSVQHVALQGLWESDAVVAQVPARGGGNLGRIRGRRRQRIFPDLPDDDDTLILPPDLPLPRAPILPGLPTIDPVPDVRRRRRRQIEVLVAIGVLKGR
jgi:hypothetical protein